MDSQSTTPSPAPVLTRDTGDGSGRHPVNLTHLILGVVFLGFAGLWAAIAGDFISDADLRWLLPVPWLLAGSAGLLALTVSRLRRERATGSHGDVGVVGDDSVDTGVQEGPDFAGEVTGR